MTLKPVTLTPQEFGVLVDLALNANAPVGRVLQFGDLFARCAKLANGTCSIGEIKPATPSLGDYVAVHPDPDHVLAPYHGS